jgi:glycosyltransferase involved in cell wall biosynthesis
MMSAHSSSPAVSVIVPNYNHARYLQRRLDSILGQSFKNFELIVLDDCSTDNSRGIIQPYLRDGRIRFHPNQANSGSPFIQWNRGVSMARGELIWIAESDDYADPEQLATLVPLLGEHPQVGLAYCQSWRIDSNDNLEGTMGYWTDDLDPVRWTTGYVNPGRDECENYLLWKNTVPNASGVVFRKAVYLAAGGAPIGMRLCGDWLAWVRLLLKSDVAFSPKPLNYFRQHSASLRELTALNRHFDEKWKVQRFILQQCQKSKLARSKLARQALADFLVRVRNAVPGNRNREILRGMAGAWPFFMLAPATVTHSFLKRHQK